MSGGLEFKTTRCAAHGHPEFTLRLARALPIPDIERVLLGYFEGAVARGTKFLPGQTVQFGWATLRLKQRDDGTLGVLEPDVGEAMAWAEHVDQALMDTWRQQEVARSLGLEHALDFPRQAQHAVVCTRALETAAFVLARTAPEGPTDSGWFIGCVDETHSHDVAEHLTVVPLIEVAANVPPLTQFFALPVGCDVTVLGPGRVRARVFQDGDELKPKPGSYLDALNAPGN